MEKNKKQKTLTQPVTRKWHEAFVRKDEQGASAVPAFKKTSTKQQSLDALAAVPVDEPELEPQPLESIDDILARPAPPDEPEYISFATARGNPQMWAPLISGTTQEEKQRIEHELAAVGKFNITERYHPAFLKTRNEDPGNFNKLLFYEGAPPKRKLAIAGFAKDPLIIDPPGCGTPFDALKFPDRLVAQLNRDHTETLYGWDAKALRQIPKELMLRVDPAVLAKMPDEVLSRQPPEVLDLLPSESPFFSNLPLNSKLKRPEHRAGYIRNQNDLQGGHESKGDGRGPVYASESDEGLRDENGRFLKAPSRRDSRGKFLPKSALVEDVPVLAKKQDKGKEREIYVAAPTVQAIDKTGGSKGPVAPVSDDKCSTCLTMGIKCNGKKPICLWCSRNKYQCSFQTETATIRPMDSQASQPRVLRGLGITNLHLEPQAYVLPFSQEESFSTRPSIRITIPDHLKNLLVDDWENVTKSLLLVPLPSQAPANFIIDTYYNEEKMNRRLGSAEADVLEEFCAGMKVYFEKSVGKILLYRFERSQLADVSLGLGRFLDADVLLTLLVPGPQALGIWSSP